MFIGNFWGKNDKATEQKTCNDQKVDPPAGECGSGSWKGTVKISATCTNGSWVQNSPEVTNRYPEIIGNPIQKTCSPITVIYHNVHYWHQTKPNGNPAYESTCRASIDETKYTGCSISVNGTVIDHPTTSTLTVLSALCGNDGKWYGFFSGDKNDVAVNPTSKEVVDCRDVGYPASQLVKCIELPDTPNLTDYTKASILLSVSCGG